MSIPFLIVRWEGRFMDIDFFLVLVLVISEVFKISFYFWLHCVVFVTSCGLSLTVASRGHSTVAMCRLLIDFSCCRAQALGTLASFSSCSVWLKLLSSCGMWNLHEPGIKPGSPALTGGFLSTSPRCPILVILNLYQLHNYLFKKIIEHCKKLII